MRFTVLVLLLSPIMFAQDAGQQTQQIAVQQAQQAQQIANQQTQQAQQDTIRAEQEARDANLRANQQLMDAAAAAVTANTNPPPPNSASVRVTRTPKFSPKAGTFKGIPPQVEITVATKGAAIYYTTDGSTPTPTSARYTGPITISRTTTLKAMAVASASGQSATAQGRYIVK